MFSQFPRKWFYSTRQAYLAEKRLPIALQRASREGNSKKDRARASAAEKRLGEIEHAVAKEKERLHVVDKDSHGLARLVKLVRNSGRVKKKLSEKPRNNTQYTSVEI